MIHFLLRLGLATALCLSFVHSTHGFANAGDDPSRICNEDLVCDDGNVCTDDRCAISGGEVCGDPNSSGDLTAVDALHVLNSATGLESMCRSIVCDVDANGSVTATDALRVLQAAVGMAAGVVCQGECVHSPVTCDDQDPCTEDTCDASSGCTHQPINCDDGNRCNGEEFCMPELGCVVTAPLDCDDGDACTDDICDDSDGCVHEPIDCNDGSDCTDDRCDPTDGCVHEGADCDDDNPCTMDMCLVEGGCGHLPVDCNDGNVCNGEEQCDAELGCVAGQALVCDDGQFCNGQEQCDSELGCVAGDAPDCSDDEECTEDACDEETDQCLHKGAAGGSADVIGFSGLPAGTIVGEVFADGGAGPVLVFGENSHLPEMNAAVVYDSDCPGGECSGKGSDLGTPNETFEGPGIGEGGEAGAPYENSAAQGNLLIVAKDLVDVDPADGLVDVPKDQAHDQEVSTHFDFSAIAPVVLESLRIMDVDGEEEAPIIDIYGAGDVLLASVVAPATGDNGIAHVDLGNVEGAWSMVVSLFGSGAIDDIAFNSGECVEETTTTTSTSTTTSTTTSTSMPAVTTTIPMVTTTMRSGTTTTYPVYTTTTVLTFEDGLNW